MPVEVSSRPTAVALDPNGVLGSLPRAFCRAAARRHVRGHRRELAQAGQSEVGQRRRGGVDDLLQEVPGRGEDVGQVDAVPDVQAGRVGLDVGRAAAGRVGDVVGTADVTQVLVHPGGVAVDHRPGLRFGSRDRVGEQVLHHVPVVQVGDQGIGLQVGPVHRDLVVVGALGSEVARTLATGGEHHVGQRADRGLRGRVAGPEAERAVVGGDDVRNPVRGASDPRGVGRRVGGRRHGGRRGRHGPERQDEQGRDQGAGGHEGAEPDG